MQNANMYTLMASNSTSVNFLRFGIDGDSQQCHYDFLVRCKSQKHVISVALWAIKAHCFNSAQIIILQQLLSRPGRNLNRLVISFNQDLVTSPEPPVVDLSCSGVADNQTGLYTVRIEFSYANVSLINEAINEYSISMRNLDFTVGIDVISIHRETLELSNVLV